MSCFLKVSSVSKRLCVLLAGTLATVNWMSSSALASDRFIVPVPDSSPPSAPPPPAPPPPSPPSPPAPPPSTSSGPSTSYTPTTPSDTSGGRFIVPVPGNSSSSDSGRFGSSGGFSSGGRRYNGGGSYSDPYWGGCYYWGGHYYYWGGYYYSPDYDRFGRYRYDSFYGPGAISNVRNDPVFFPPNPPPLGAPIPPQPPEGTRLVAPAQLAVYVDEPFYAPLSTRLAAKDLTSKLEQRLTEFSTQRSALREELQSRLESLATADPATRQRELAAFAREQDSRIKQLNTTAEQLRTELLRNGLVGLFWGKGDWNRNRTWKLGVGSLSGPRTQTLSYEFQVMRAAVFYQDGLLPAQRRLLREIAMELQVEAFKPASASASPEDSALVYFSPATARARLPDDVPSDLTTVIAAFEKEKSALKTELRDTLYQEDSTSSSHRLQSLKRLADKQGPRLDALEELAEEIRAGLVRAGKQPGRPAVPPAFPPALAARIAAYKYEKADLLKGLQAKLDTKQAHLDNAKVRLRDSSGSLERITIQVHSRDVQNDAKLEPVREIVAAYNEENAKRFSALTKEKEAIRNEVSALSRSPVESSPNKAVETLLKEFDEALKQQEVWQQYHDYRTAVFEPGLSPTQRRLLFGAAMEKLTLPLPGGEDLP